MGEHICFVIDYGWIIEGVAVSRANGTIHLSKASVVRKWRNGRGIGAIADPTHKDEYTLDPIGDVFVRDSRVLFEIPLNW